MKRDYKLYLQDIKESIEDIQRYSKGISEEEFKKNKEKQDAIIRRFEIIGEASRNIPRVVKEKNKDIPWFEMSQFRDLIAHAYYDISLDRVWNSIKERIPKIKEALNTISLV